MSKIQKSVFLIITILILDQIVKFAVKLNFQLGDEIHIFGNWFIIHFTENYGMAFGLEFGGNAGKIFLTVFRLAAIVALAFYIRNLSRKNAPIGFILCLSMILAGALGNVIDSAFYGMIFSHSFAQVATLFPENGGYATFLHGKVVDMLYLPIIQTHYPSWFPFLGSQELVFFRPVFNIADSSISIGVFIILFYQKKFFNFDKQTTENKESAEQISTE